MCDNHFHCGFSRFHLCDFYKFFSDPTDLQDALRRIEKEIAVPGIRREKSGKVFCEGIEEVSRDCDDR